VNCARKTHIKHERNTVSINYRQLTQRTKQRNASSKLCDISTYKHERKTTSINYSRGKVTFIILLIFVSLVKLGFYYLPCEALQCTHSTINNGILSSIMIFPLFVFQKSCMRYSCMIYTQKRNG
jgi:hypothetical protein